MDKNTLLAGILSTVVIIVWFAITGLPSSQPVNEPIVQSTEVATPAEKNMTGESERGFIKSDKPVSVDELSSDEEENIKEQTVTAETERYIITFSNKGGVVKSLKLKEHLHNGNPLEMIFSVDGSAAFETAFGGVGAQPLDQFFKYTRKSKNVFEFSKRFFAPPDAYGKKNPFTLRKTYKFTDDDYMMELRIGIENSVNKIPMLNFDGYAYSLTFGPQIGPEFSDLDKRYTYRRFSTYDGGKKPSNAKIKDGRRFLEERFTWIALNGKYFSAIAIPDATEYDVTLLEKEENNQPQYDKIVFSRPPLNSSNNEDVFKFYIGPKLGKYLKPYNRSDQNGFSMKDLNLDLNVRSNPLIGWLEFILQKALIFIHRYIPNYGIAIIIITLLIKIILFPLTKKSTQSTAKMSALAPKMEELKAQYKDQPENLNKAMSELYKSEGVNPMGGCLPILLQFPFFIAMYNMFNKYFEFRGAVFIPGWITDLSLPESIMHFSWTIPFLNWSDIRLLPIIYVGSQILSMKITQSQQTATSTNSQMKMMMYGMPIMFFFILYNAPSGLLVYWICSNILGMLQQIYTNKHLKPKLEAVQTTGAKINGKPFSSAETKKIVPPVKKKKKKKKK